MSLSKPQSPAFNFQELPIPEVAKILVEKAISLKPTLTDYAPHGYLKHVMNEIPSEIANELTRIIIKISDTINRPDILPLISHQECDTVLIPASEGKILVPNIIGNIGFLKGLTTLKFDVDENNLTFATPRRESEEQNLMYLAICIRHLTKLTLVHLPYICTTEILYSVVENCPLLEDMDIHGSEFDVLVIRNLAKCKNLKYLNVDDVGSEAVLAPHVAYVLQNVPQLRSIGKFDLQSVMDYMLIKSEDLFEEFNDYKLESAFLRNRDSNIDMVKLFQYFPVLEKIESKKEFGGNLKCLFYFSMLKSITLTNEHVTDLFSLFSNASNKFHHVELRATQSVTELFRNCCFTELATLELHYCGGISLEDIANSARNITKFTLDHCTTSNANSVKNTKGFGNLQKLTIAETALSTSELKLLFDNCDELSDLSLSSVYIRERNEGETLLSSELFYELVDYEKKTNLQFVKLTRLRSICRIVLYLIGNFHAITNIAACDETVPDDERVDEIRSQIVDIIRCDPTRNLTIKITGLPPLYTSHAIENDDPCSNTNIQKLLSKPAYQKYMIPQVQQYCLLPQMYYQFPLPQVHYSPLPQVQDQSLSSGKLRLYFRQPR